MPRLLKSVLLISWFSFFYLTFVLAEEITITTYYPSPYGSYNQLQTMTLGVGDNDGVNGLTSADVPDPATKPGEVWIHGKVGIGTTTPIATLTVGNNVAGLGVGGNSWISLGLSEARNVSGIVMGSDTVANRYLQMVWNNDSNYGEITTSDTTQSLILQQNKGRVGIGTTDPQTLLHLYNTSGDVELRMSADGSYDPVFRMTGENGNLTEGFIIQYDNSVGDVYLGQIWPGIIGNVPAIRFSTANASNAMVIAGNGNVGIGVIRTSQKLEVNGQIKSTNLLVTDLIRSDRLIMLNYVNSPNYQVNGVPGYSGSISVLSSCKLLAGVLTCTSCDLQVSSGIIIGSTCPAASMPAPEP